MRIIDHATDARSLARVVVLVDSIQGLRVLRAAAVDPRVPHEPRGEYQVAVYNRLDPAELEALYLETFHSGVQSGLYARMGPGELLIRPDADEIAPRLVREVLEDPLQELAPWVLGSILDVVTIVHPDRFDRADRERIWAHIEPRLESLPPEMREAAESHGADLMGGPA